jgi:hypothetical protein
VNQVQLFYEAPPSTLWITFYADCLWWCFANADINCLDDGTKLRKARDGWRNCDVLGRPLLKARLSGKVLAVQGFQGTICSVSEHSYLLHKINGTVPPHLATAQDALENLQVAIIPLIRSLHPKDFEIFTDLIFRQTGWQRTGVVGEVERDIDIDVLSPITGERVAVQVKSAASLAQYVEYRQKYADMRGFARFYFVTHSPSRDLQDKVRDADDPQFVYWGPQQLAQLAARNGLIGWLLDKAS